VLDTRLICILDGFSNLKMQIFSPKTLLHTCNCWFSFFNEWKFVLTYYVFRQFLGFIFKTNTYILNRMSHKDLLLYVVWVMWIPLPHHFKLVNTQRSVYVYFFMYNKHTNLCVLCVCIVFNVMILIKSHCETINVISTALWLDK